MTFAVLHTPVAQALRVTKDMQGDLATVRCQVAGNFRVPFPGELQISAAASFFKQVRIEPAGPAARANDGFDQQEVPLALHVVIRTPDGQPFTALIVQLAWPSRMRAWKSFNRLPQGPEEEGALGLADRRPRCALARP